MEKILEILNEVNPDIDYLSENRLVEDRVLDSIQIVYLISLLSEEYCIDIELEDLIPENFNSLESILLLLRRYCHEN